MMIANSDSNERQVSASNGATLILRISALARWAVRKVFTVSLITYLVLYLVDSFADLFVTKHFNTNILLWIVVCSGVVSTIIDPVTKQVQGHTHSRKAIVKSMAFIVILGIITAAAIFVKSKTLGGSGYLIAGISGILVILLSFILLNEEDGPESENNQ